MKDHSLYLIGHNWRAKHMSFVDVKGFSYIKANSLIGISERQDLKVLTSYLNDILQVRALLKMN